jgi:hypothetical protein
MAKQVTQVRVAQYTVGLVGLVDAFQEVRQSDPPDDESCQEELLRRIQVDNFVPETAEADYKKALWCEYRRWKGEQNPRTPQD